MIQLFFLFLLLYLFTTCKTHNNKSGERGIPISTINNYYYAVLLINHMISYYSTSTHSGSLRNYTIEVIQVTLLECKMRLNYNIKINA